MPLGTQPIQQRMGGLPLLPPYKLAFGHDNVHMAGRKAVFVLRVVCRHQRHDDGPPVHKGQQVPYACRVKVSHKGHHVTGGDPLTLA